MANLKMKIVGAIGILGLLSPVITKAQVSTTTANEAISSVISDVSQSMGTNILLIIGVLAGLIALRWGITRFMRWVSGRKF